MRNVPLKRITALFGLLASFAASADCSVDACSDVYVDQIYVDSGTNNWIRTSGTETNLSVCAPDSGVYLWLDGTATQKKEVLAALMLAGRGVQHVGTIDVAVKHAQMRASNSDPGRPRTICYGLLLGRAAKWPTSSVQRPRERCSLALSTVPASHPLWLARTP